ncbi:MAG: hypothetical protein ACYCZ6_01050 [Polaromonas sp.]
MTKRIFTGELLWDQENVEPAPGDAETFKAFTAVKNWTPRAAGRRRLFNRIF